MARKAQAALEYLVTYGWGFLVILVVVGALAYFGLLSPSRYIPAKCEFGAQLECVDYKLQSTGGLGTVQLQFRNNYGADIQIKDVFTIGQTGSSTYTMLPDNFIAKGNVSSILALTLTANNMGVVLSRGDKISVPLIITITRAGGTNPLHNVTGEIYATVQ